MVRSKKAHADRRNEFLDTARRLFLEKGYEETSINDVLAAMGVAKGTFYHYFKSKEELLQQMADRFSNQVCDDIKDLADRADLPPLEKIKLYFTRLRSSKMADLGLLKLMINVLYTDENLLLRHKIFQYQFKHLTPHLARIIGQGAEAGVLHPVSDEYVAVAEIIFALFDGVSEMFGAMLGLIEKDPRTLKMFSRKWIVVEKSVERLLGVTGGTTRIIDDGILKLFFSKKSAARSREKGS